MDLDNILRITTATLSVCVGIGAIFAGLGYFTAQFKDGSNKGKLSAIQLMEAQLKAMETEITSLNARLDEKKGIEVHLMSQVETLTKENKELRDLIMLNQIPKPLEEFVINVAGKNFDAINSLTIAMNAKFDALAASLTHLPKRSTDPRA